MKKMVLSFFLTVILVIVTGCGMMQTATVVPAAGDEAATNAQGAAETISKEDDANAGKIISEYFTALYTDALVDNYNDYTKSGVIPNEIRGFIADKTIKEGDGNPEIGIHLPRYISINGMTIIGYSIEKIKAENGEEKANIVSDFISRSGDNYLYYVKIYCKAKAIPDESFAKAYQKNDDNTYTKISDINPEDIDYMRVELRFDVELSKSDVGFSIVKATEANIKPGMKNRLFVNNNANATRLSYLDLSKNQDGSYKNQADGETYEAEKTVITEFFPKLTELDRERMNLLSYWWKQGVKPVTEFFDSIGVTTGEEGKKLIVLNEKYDTNYPLNSFPLRNNMERITEIKNFEVIPHPAYSEKIKLYYVKFDATVRKTNGITDEYFTYRYDYIVSLARTEESVFIEKFKLNEYYTIQ